jgi:ribonuclease VapC
VIVALIHEDPEAILFRRWICRAEARRLSAANYVEAAAVIDGRRDPRLSAALDHALAGMRIGIVPSTPGQAAIAREAYQRFGRGSGHPARPNMGDCYAYAVARDLGEPLLNRGSDFALTDIERLTEPIRRNRLGEALASTRRARRVRRRRSAPTSRGRAGGLDGVGRRATMTACRTRPTTSPSSTAAVPTAGWRLAPTGRR